MSRHPSRRSSLQRLAGNVTVGILAAASLWGCASQRESAASRDARAAQAETTDPERRVRLRLELAGLYFGRGQSATALEEVQRALAIRPDSPEAWSLLGLIHASLGDTARADSAFRRATVLNPRDADVMHNHGWFLCQQGRYDEAGVLFERALAQPQYRDTVRTTLAQGVCHARAGRWADAERSLARSYELDPANPITAFNLSEVLLRRGELERARFYVRRINAVADLSSAQSLWLAARIERRLGNLDTVQDFGRQLRDRFPQSTEALQYEQGRFDD